MVESPDSFQRGAYTTSDKALHGKKSLATTDYQLTVFYKFPMEFVKCVFVLKRCKILAIKCTTVS